MYVYLSYDMCMYQCNVTYMCSDRLLINANLMKATAIFTVMCLIRLEFIYYIYIYSTRPDFWRAWQQEGFDSYWCCISFVLCSTFTPSGGHVRNKKTKGGRGFHNVGSRGSSNPSSRAGSEEPEASFSSSESSEEEPNQMNTMDLLDQVCVCVCVCVCVWDGGGGRKHQAARLWKAHRVCTYV